MGKIKTMGFEVKFFEEERMDTSQSEINTFLRRANDIKTASVSISTTWSQEAGNVIYTPCVTIGWGN